MLFNSVGYFKISLDQSLIISENVQHHDMSAGQHIFCNNHNVLRKKNQIQFYNGLFIIKFHTNMFILLKRSPGLAWDVSPKPSVHEKLCVPYMTFTLVPFSGRFDNRSLRLAHLSALNFCCQKRST